MKISHALILFFACILSGCIDRPSSTFPNGISPTAEQTAPSTFTPSITSTNTPKPIVEPSSTVTLEPNAISPSSIYPTLTPLSYTPEPTPPAPSFAKLQVISRTNAKNLIPIWRLEHFTDSEKDESMPFDFSPDGKTIAFLENANVFLLDIQSGQIYQTFSASDFFPPAEQVGFWEVYFSPDGKRLAGNTDKGPVLWDVSAGKPLWKADWNTADPFTIGSPITDIVFSPKGDLLVTTSVMAGSDIRIWSEETGKLLKELGVGNQLNAAFSPDGKRLYTVDRLEAANAVRIWSTETWQQIGAVNVQRQAYSTLLSTNGERMIIGSDNIGDGPRSLRIYGLGELDEWKHIGTIEDRKVEVIKGGVVATTLKSIITYPTLNRDGGIIAFATRDSEGTASTIVQLWDVANQIQIMDLQWNFPTPIWFVRFSPDGRLLAAQSVNGTTLFWGIPSQ